MCVQYDDVCNSGMYLLLLEHQTHSEEIWNRVGKDSHANTIHVCSPQTKKLILDFINWALREPSYIVNKKYERRIVAMMNSC